MVQMSNKVELRYRRKKKKKKGFQDKTPKAEDDYC